MEEREASERKTEGFQKKLQELFTSLNVTLGGDFGQPTAGSFDKLISRVSEPELFSKIQYIASYSLDH